MVSLLIDGKKVEVPEKTTVLQAARQLGIEIPTLCDHPDLTPYGGCRLCTVIVEKARLPQTACTLPVSEGMVVYTDTPDLVLSRVNILKLLLSNYYDSGYALVDHDEEDNQLLYWAKYYGLDVAKYSRTEPKFPVDVDPNPFIWVDLNKCILCARCIRACAEVQGRFVWGFAERGIENHLVAGAGDTLLEAHCESCGACVAYCPTGALDNKLSMGLGKPTKRVDTICPYCGVGCSFTMEIRDNRILRIKSKPDAAVNGLHLCVKGRYGYEFVHHPDRLKMPMVRKYVLEGTKRPKEKNDSPWVEVSWDTAISIVANKFVNIKKESGRDAIGILTSAKCSNEENYLMNKFSRQVIGTHNIDHCARLCHASTVTGLAMSLGSGAMTNTIKDTCENAQAMFVIGSNTTEQHPVLGAKIRQAVVKRDVRLIVADPRKIDLTDFATLHLRHKPGTDVALINGLMHILVQNNWHDHHYIEERCENFEEFQLVIEKYTPELVESITGVPQKQLNMAAEIMAEYSPMAVFWAMGITQHTTGVFNVLSLSNLQLLLGNIGVVGGGVNPLRGQNNVQGACDMGGLPNVFPGYQSVSDPEIRKKFMDAWELEDGSTKKSAMFGDTQGLTVTEMVSYAEKGKVRALYIMAENPVMSDPDSNHTRKALNACEFIVLQEIFPSETAPYADVLLPGVSFAEKDGTVTNTERRVQFSRKGIEPLGESQSDWEIINTLATKILELEERTPKGKYSNWNYTSVDQVMDEIAALTPIYAGVNYRRLFNNEQLHWPVLNEEHPGTPILHRESFTRGKGKFFPIEHIDPVELPDDHYPYLLTTGRVLYHWHGAEMTRRSQGLIEVYPESLIEINIEDARKLGITDRNQYVQVISRRGVMKSKVFITDRVYPGLVFANFHFPDEQNTNNLTINAVDPQAKIPEYKVCAVKINLI